MRCMCIKGLYGELYNYKKGQTYEYYYNVMYYVRCDGAKIVSMNIEEFRENFVDLIEYRNYMIDELL